MSPFPDEVRDAVMAALAKYGPGLAGSFLSLRFLPKDATFSDRLWASVGGVASAFFLTPAVVEVAGVASARVEGSMGFLAGVIGMALLGQLAAAVREVRLVSILTDALRSRLGLKPTEDKKEGG
jgi:hypothetical protein